MKHIFNLLLITLLLSGCQRDLSPDAYNVSAVGQVNRVVRGIVISARPVDISGSKSGVGAGAGALAGGVAGSSIGGNARTNIIGAVGGAVVGGVAGAVVEEGSTRQTGMEYVVEATNGALLTVVQGDNKPLAVGQTVLVIYGNPSRIIPDKSQVK